MFWNQLKTKIRFPRTHLSLILLTWSILCPIGGRLIYLIVWWEECEMKWKLFQENSNMCVYCSKLNVQFRKKYLLEIIILFNFYTLLTFATYYRLFCQGSSNLKLKSLKLCKYKLLERKWNLRCYLRDPNESSFDLQLKQINNSQRKDIF